MSNAGHQAPPWAVACMPSLACRAPQQPCSIGATECRTQFVVVVGQRVDRSKHGIGFGNAERVVCPKDNAVIACKIDDESLAPSKLEDSFKPDLPLHHAREGGGRLVQGEGLDHGLYPLLLREGHRVR